MEVLNDILGYKNMKIFQDADCFAFSLDSILLANFATIRIRDKKIVDLCSGNGVIPLILSLRTKKDIIGVELQEKLSSLANKSIIYNELSDRISMVNMNIKDFCSEDNIEKYDLITCNPPYFKVNEKNFFKLSQEKKIARHEVEITLSEVINISKKLLKNGGNFAIVHRPERLMEILFEFRSNGIEPKKIQFVYENVEKGSTLVLIEGQKSGKPGLKIERPFILYDLDGTMTDEYSKLLIEVRK